MEGEEDGNDKEQLSAEGLKYNAVRTEEDRDERHPRLPKHDQALPVEGAAFVAIVKEPVSLADGERVELIFILEEEKETGCGDSNHPEE